MSTSSNNVQKILASYEVKKKVEDHYEQLRARSPEELESLNIKSCPTATGKSGQDERIQFLKKNDIQAPTIFGEKPFEDHDSLHGNIENFIGMAQIPIGLAGPLLINGTHSSGVYHVPLATTEGALVASYSRGMKACRESGGATAVSLSEGVQRSPFFKFGNIVETATFVKFVHSQLPVLKELVSKKSGHAKLNEIRTNVEGNSVIFTFEYSTGDAAGQNMVTLCTHHICMYLIGQFHIKPTEWYVESNYSGDKKATMLAFQNVRGKKVTVEIVLQKEIIESVLKSTPEKMQKYWQSSTLAVLQSGSIGAQGHIANGLTALFIACGQDVACISESSIGLTRMQLTAEGDLYVSLTMPGLITGTVGGGTSLPTQQECLRMLGCEGVGNSRKFSEICCAIALAGEISIAAAMSVDHFSNAHEALGRKEKK